MERDEKAQKKTEKSSYEGDENGDQNENAAAKLFIGLQYICQRSSEHEMAFVMR